jgi:MFS family permease
VAFRSENDAVQKTLIAVAGSSRFMAGILMGTVMALYVEDAGASEFVVSMVLTAYFLGMMVFSPIWGAIADVTGRRRAVMVISGILGTIAVIPLATVGKAGPTIVLPFLTIDGVWVPVGLRALYAAFAVGFVPVMLTIVSARGGAEARGRSMGFFNSARAVGSMSGQLGAGVLLGILLPSGLYLVIAGLSLVSTVAAAIVYDPTPTPDGDFSAAEIVGEVRRRLLPAVEDRGHLRTNGLRWLYVALALRNMTVLGAMSLMAIYITGPLEVSEVLMGVILAFNPGGQVVFMYLFGRIADSAGRKPLIVAGMAGSGLFAVVAALSAVPEAQIVRVVVIAVAFVIIAAAFSAMTTGALAFIGDVAPPERESELMGLRSTAKGVSGVLGPPIIGGLATVTSIQLAVGVASLLAFVAAALAAVALTESRPADAAAGRAVGTRPSDD